MCLSKITRKQTLKKDKKVWKAVKILNGKEYSYGEYSNKIGDVLSGWIKHDPRMREFAGIVKAEILTITIGKSSDKDFGNYLSGFHCLLHKRDADEFIKIARWHGVSVVDYIIPAGTPVLYGKQHGRTVIVTPVLRNPRTPGKN